MKLRIAVNGGCKNKESQPAYDWLNINESLEWLQGWVSAGYGWCATHFAGRHRRQDNAVGSNLIVVDIDGDTTLGRFWQTDTARNWCVATYTSASHTEQENRFRALFPLEKMLDSVGQHKGAYWLVVNRLLADLGFETIKDNCGQKRERLWYGNTKAEWTVNPGAIVPAFLLEDIDYEDVTDFVASDVSDKDIQRCQWLLRNFLTPSEDGEYESRYVPVMAACAAMGERSLTTGLTGFSVVTTVRNLKTFSHGSGEVSVTIVVLLNCIRLPKSKTVTGLHSCHQSYALVQQDQLLDIQSSTSCRALMK